MARQEIKIAEWRAPGPPSPRENRVVSLLVSGPGLRAAREPGRRGRLGCTSDPWRRPPRLRGSARSWDSRPVPSGCGEAALPQGHSRRGAGVPGQGLGLCSPPLASPPSLPLGRPCAPPLTLPPSCAQSVGAERAPRRPSRSSGEGDPWWGGRRAVSWKRTSSVCWRIAGGV